MAVKSTVPTLQPSHPFNLVIMQNLVVSHQTVGAALCVWIWGSENCPKAAPLGEMQLTPKEPFSLPLPPC